jgi:hypothetical protein
VAMLRVESAPRWIGKESFWQIGHSFRGYECDCRSVRVWGSLLRVAGQKRVGEILYRDFAVDVVDAPDAVVLLLGPGFVGWNRTEGGGKLGDLAVMPDYKYYFARVLAAEKSGCQGPVVVVFEAVIDG